MAFTALTWCMCDGLTAQGSLYRQPTTSLLLWYWLRSVCALYRPCYGTYVLSYVRTACKQSSFSVNRNFACKILMQSAAVLWLPPKGFSYREVNWAVGTCFKLCYTNWTEVRGQKDSYWKTFHTHCVRSSFLLSEVSKIVTACESLKLEEATQGHPFPTAFASFWEEKDYIHLSDASGLTA
jgi:hypothetical protein